MGLRLYCTKGEKAEGLLKRGAAAGNAVRYTPADHRIFISQTRFQLFRNLRQAIGLSETLFIHAHQHVGIGGTVAIRIVGLKQLQNPLAFLDLAVIQTGFCHGQQHFVPGNGVGILKK